MLTVFKANVLFVVYQKLDMKNKKQVSVINCSRWQP